MFSSLLYVMPLAIFLVAGAPSDYEKMNQQLINVSKQLDRLELKLDNGITQLLKKVDETSQNVVNLIKSSVVPSTTGNDHSTGRPVSALLIIDVQNDFINGTLALRNCPSRHNGEEVVPVINHLLDSINFDVVVYSYDWHPTDHISFLDNLPLRAHLLAKDSTPLADLRVYSTAIFSIDGVDRMEQTLWPRHCVQNTVGAQLHPDLKSLDEDSNQTTSVINIYKGTKSNIDSYSAFWDNMKLSETTLNRQLKEKHVTQVFVVGLATDVCVYSTALHALEYGYKTFVVEDACRGVDEEQIKKRLDELVKKKAHVIQSDQVKNYIE